MLKITRFAAAPLENGSFSTSTQTLLNRPDAQSRCALSRIIGSIRA